MIALKKILIVDDSPMIHSMYKLILKKYKGCKITDAMNGLEALDILSREKDFDLIILDINMPVMNGLQFMRKLQAENLTRDTVIIVSSVEGKEEDILGALMLGAAGYVVKPFKPQMLYNLMETLFESNQSTFAGLNSG